MQIHVAQTDRHDMYVLDHDRQLLLIREMTQLRKDNQSWEVYYHHPTTNVMWKSYFPKATSKDKGPKILRTEPVPEVLETRIENCLVERVPENAIGLGIELSTEPQKWEQVINIVEKNYREYHRKQLPLFLNHLKVEDFETLFEEIDYNLEDSAFSKAHFEDLAARSRTIRLKRFFVFF